MNEKKTLVVSALMPVSAQLDEFLQNYEYLDTGNLQLVPDMKKLFANIQDYVNGVYAALKVTVDEWNAISKGVLGEQSQSNNDQRASWKWENNMGSEGDGGQPVKV